MGTLKEKNIYPVFKSKYLQSSFSFLVKQYNEYHPYFSLILSKSLLRVHKDLWCLSSVTRVIVIMSFVSFFKTLCIVYDGRFSFKYYSIR